VDRYFIEGGIPLKGEVRISGSKNAVLPIMAATLLTEHRCVIENVPMIDDIMTMAEILRHLGAKVECDEAQRQVSIEAASVNRFDVPIELAAKIRASFLVAGPLLARFGRAVFPPPGGDVIGRRPVDVTLRGFSELGADIQPGSPCFTARADRLGGVSVYLDYPTHTGTEDLMMAACLARGRTIIANASPEPEVTDLAEFLRRMGARIRGDGTPFIEIEGRDKLYGAGHRLIPDRIEAGTFAVAAAITGGDVVLHNVLGEHMVPVTYKLHQVGVGISIDESASTYHVTAGDLRRTVEVQTLPFPGFPTDLQSVFTAMLTQVRDPRSDTSYVRERVYEDRLRYVAELRKLGAEVELEGQMAVIRSPRRLSGAEVRVLDIRAGAALVVAGLAAEGTTVIVDHEHHIRRGYERIERKLASLGARIRRESAEPRAAECAPASAQP
jgi:UDP-N-acetylglucosamine 1-carboxyvinyltransferase